MDIIKHYSNGEVTIVWKPDLCIHSANCFRNLPEVFDPRVKPWIQPENADSERIIAVVRACPSGALSLGENTTTEPSV
ncbi:MAG TPA: (4Fe-4S)-binding protein [Bacteroidetes bacterium]|nr:(4Fe-4S)-binding protein [Bacteroidota bacterium]HRK03656.1 (4Fe-4S)-binding protein [Chlorobiota bacterium]